MDIKVNSKILFENVEGVLKHIFPQISKGIVRLKDSTEKIVDLAKLREASRSTGTYDTYRKDVEFEIGDLLYQVDVSVKTYAEEDTNWFGVDSWEIIDMKVLDNDAKEVKVTPEMEDKAKIYINSDRTILSESKFRVNEDHEFPTWLTDPKSKETAEIQIDGEAAIFGDGGIYKYKNKFATQALAIDNYKKKGWEIDKQWENKLNEAEYGVPKFVDYKGFKIKVAKNGPSFLVRLLNKETDKFRQGATVDYSKTEEEGIQKGKEFADAILVKKESAEKTIQDMLKSGDKTPHDIEKVLMGAADEPNDTTYNMYKLFVYDPTSKKLKLREGKEEEIEIAEQVYCPKCDKQVSDYEAREDGVYCNICGCNIYADEEGLFEEKKKKGWKVTGKGWKQSPKIVTHGKGKYNFPEEQEGEEEKEKLEMGLEENKEEAAALNNISKEMFGHGYYTQELNADQREKVRKQYAKMRESVTPIIKDNLTDNQTKEFEKKIEEGEEIKIAQNISTNENIYNDLESDVRFEIKSGLSDEDIMTKMKEKYKGKVGSLTWDILPLAITSTRREEKPDDLVESKLHETTTKELLVLFINQGKLWEDIVQMVPAFDNKITKLAYDWLIKEKVDAEKAKLPENKEVIPVAQLMGKLKVKEAKIRESILIAERDKAIELGNLVETQLKETKANYIKDVIELTEQLNKAIYNISLLEEIKKENKILIESINQKDKTLGSLSESIGESSIKVEETKKKLEENKVLLEAKNKEIKSLNEAHIQEVSRLKSAHTLELVGKYKDTVLKTRGLKLPSSLQTIFEGCKTEAEVDELIDSAVGTIREGVLHSDKLSEISIGVKVDESKKILGNKVASAFKGMGIGNAKKQS